MKVKHGLFILIFFAAAWLALPASLAAPAPAINIIGPTAAVREGGRAIVEVRLVTGEDAINTVGGTIKISSQDLAVDSISDGNSIINYWVERPVAAADSTVRFSGVVPGGFSGDKGRLFSIIFKAQKSGEFKVSLEDGKMLLHDGLGTTLDAAPTSATIVASATGTINDVEAKDEVPPEPFSVEVTSDPNLFDGKFFIAFASQDKGSGLAYYEVQEGKQPPLRADSPYELRDQSLKNPIVVKAYDRQGNIQTASWRPAGFREPFSLSGQTGIIKIGGLVLFLGALVLIIKKIWR